MLRRLTLSLVAIILLGSGAAQAQSPCAAIAYGAVLTAGQFNNCFALKQDFAGGPVLPLSGGVMTGPLVTAASSATTAGFNLPPGAAPTSPNNGDMWTTNGGLFIQINGVTVGPLTSGGASGSFTSTYPIAVTFPSAGVVNYALNYDAKFTVTSNALALANIASGNLLANSSSGSAEPTSSTLTALIDRALGSAQGSVLNRGASSWSATPTPTLGSSGTVGSLTLGNLTSGTVTLQAVTGALGTVTASLPANTGIIAELNLNQTWIAVQFYGSGDLVLNGSGSGSTALNASPIAGSTVATLPANTGVIAELNLAQSWTQPQTFAANGVNLLGSGAGYTTLASANTSVFNYVMTFPAITDTVVTLTSSATLMNKTLTSPILSGTVTGNNTIPLPVLAQVGGGTVLGNNSSSSANVSATSTPVLGLAGSVVGTLGFANLSTGSITLQPAAGALGSAVLTMPALTDTLVTLTSSATLTNKTIASSTDVLGGVTMTLGSDATGDVYYRNASGMLTRLGIGSANNVLNVSNTGLPSWGPVNLIAAAAVTGILGGANGGTGINNGTYTVTLAGNLSTSGGAVQITTESSGFAGWSGGVLSTIGAQILAMANGGTGSAISATQYGLPYFSSTTTMGSTAAGTTSTLLQGNASGAPTWVSTLPATVQGNITAVGALSSGSLASGFTPVTGALGGTGLSTAAIGDLMYASATTPTWSRLADVAVGSVLVSGGVSTAPAWSATPALTSLALGGASIGSNALAVTGTAAISGALASAAHTVTSASASALAVGPNGATNPTLLVNASASIDATGLGIVGAAAGGGLALAVISSGGNEALTINAKGSGTIGIGNVSTGAVTITPALTLSAALTYGGVTLSNAVTGTGNMVLSASPTIASPTFSGTFAGTYTIAGTPTLSGTFAGTPAFSGANFISLANIAQVGASSLLGNSSGSTANVQAVTLGNTLNFQSTTLNVTTATATQLGAVKFDNSTITLNGAGQLQTVGAAATTIAAGSGGTLVSGSCTTNYLLYNSGGTVYCADTAALLTAGPGIGLAGTTNVTVSNIARSYLAGLTLSNDGNTPLTILDMAAGEATDSTNTYAINVGAFKKTISAPWASGNGNGGLGNGVTLTASTWYHVCLAYNGGTSDYWFDTSAVCANAPSGISNPTIFRRVGSFRTNASSQIVAFTQYGDYFYFAYVVNQTASTQFSSNITMTTPLGVSTIPLVSVQLYGTGVAANVYLTAASSSNTALNSLVAGLDQSTTTEMVNTFQAPPTNTSSQIYFVFTFSSGSGNVSISTNGYIDTRGRDN